MKFPIYMDYQATTPVDPKVFKVMEPWFVERFGNPASRSHAFGWEAGKAVDKARKEVADLIGADPREIVFTSGATESDNLAIAGVARFYRQKGDHIITVCTEHKAVLDTCRYLESEEGFKVTYLPVHPNGLVDLEQLKNAFTDKTTVVSIMAGNNEIGVVQPIAEIGAICRERKVFFHTDAAQATGKIPIDVNEMNIDLLSISGHKMYGPKGVGALYVRRRPRVRIKPVIHGGGHERGMRSGTLPTPLIVGIGAACALAAERMESDQARVVELGNRMVKAFTERLQHVQVNGDLKQRLPGSLNISFGYVEGESLMMAINKVAVSSGSACTSASLEPSYVLRSLGVGDELAHSSIRFGLGRFTTQEEVDYVIDYVIDAVNRLREMSPLWEMVQEGIDLSTIQWAEH